MRCSNCGMAIPFVGRVCAYCGADKARDQVAQVERVLWGFALGAAGYLVFGGWGAIGGAMLGTVAAMVRAGR